MLCDISFLPIQLAEGSNAAYFQLLNLFAYGTYRDYVGKKLLPVGRVWDWDDL